MYKTISGSQLTTPPLAFLMVLSISSLFDIAAFTYQITKPYLKIPPKAELRKINLMFAFTLNFSIYLRQYNLLLTLLTVVPTWLRNKLLDQLVCIHILALLSKIMERLICCLSKLLDYRGLMAQFQKQEKCMSSRKSKMTLHKKSRRCIDIMD